MLKFAFEGGFAQKIWNRGFLVCNMRMILSYFSPLDLVSIKRVKILIYLFEMLSGLSINFHKSSLYQLGPSSLDLSQILDMLYCRLGSFPLTYLDLPLKPITLSKTKWQPLIDRMRKRLAS